MTNPFSQSSLSDSARDISLATNTRHPVTARLASHPASSLAGREFVVWLLEHFMHRLSTRVSVQLWEAVFRCHPSQAHAQQWHVVGIDIRQQQRRALLCRGALCTLLVPRLLCFQGECGVRQSLNLAKRIASRRHFLGLKINHAEGLFEEGQRLYGEQRFSEATERWGQAALLQQGPSHAHLSDMLIDGRPGVAKDKNRAFELASAGAALGCAHSKGALGRCYLRGFGVIQDEARGLALGRESEAAGSFFGQIVVGYCYYVGCGGVAQDDAKAVRLYRLAAAQGHAGAQNFLAYMFDNGDGVVQDYAEALRLYRLAADQGHADAQFNLGLKLRKGQGVAQDYAEAVRLYRLAAAQGHADAQFNLAYMFENGDGVAQSYAEALRLYRLAAAQGNANAQFNLAVTLEKGRGVRKDRVEAIRLYRHAAEQGHARAALALKRLGA